MLRQVSATANIRDRSIFDNPWAAGMSHIARPETRRAALIELRMQYRKHHRMRVRGECGQPIHPAESRDEMAAIQRRIKIIESLCK